MSSGAMAMIGNRLRADQERIDRAAQQRCHVNHKGEDKPHQNRDREPNRRLLHRAPGVIGIEIPLRAVRTKDARRCGQFMWVHTEEPHSHFPNDHKPDQHREWQTMPPHPAPKTPSGFLPADTARGGFATLPLSPEEKEVGE